MPSVLMVLTCYSLTGCRQPGSLPQDQRGMGMGTLQLPQFYQQLLAMGLLGPVTPTPWMDHPRALAP